MAQARVPVFFLNSSRYLRDKYFDVVWGYLPPSTLQIDTPKIYFLNDSSKSTSFFFDVNAYLRNEYLDRAWG